MFEKEQNTYDIQTLVNTYYAYIISHEEQQLITESKWNFELKESHKL
jgi:hypothetical protein